MYPSSRVVLFATFCLTSSQVKNTLPAGLCLPCLLGRCLWRTLSRVVCGMADALAYLSSLTDASCISCAGNTAFQMTSMCHELNQQCEDFYQGVWGHLDDCRHCCQFLSQEPRRASFWQANCQGSSHFAMSTSGAPAGYGSTERLPAQEHSRSAVYGMTQEQQVRAAACPRERRAHPPARHLALACAPAPMPLPLTLTLRVAFRTTSSIARTATACRTTT